VVGEELRAPAASKLQAYKRRMGSAIHLANHDVMLWAVSRAIFFPDTIATSAASVPSLDL
jgi:hypothetical protein